MPARKRLSTSSFRRHSIADHLLSTRSITIRPCTSCTSQGVLCVLSPRDERCEQCYRFNRRCDLASPWAEDDRFQRKEEELREQRLEAEIKAARLRKQERQLQKKRKALWEREKQNVDELEADEAAAEAVA
jgi:hypothetical protein